MIENFFIAHSNQLANCFKRHDWSSGLAPLPFPMKDLQLAEDFQVLLGHLLVRPPRLEALK